MARNIKELLKLTRQRRKAEITLSTGDVIELYFTPLTEAEDEKIRESVENDKRPNAYGLRVLVNKAEYADGTKMFSVADLGPLRNEYAKSDLQSMMEALIFNGGVLAKKIPKAIKEAIKNDPRLMIRLALCKELGMTPSQLKRNATQDDIIMLAAYFDILADEMPKPGASSAPRPRRR